MMAGHGDEAEVTVTPGVVVDSTPATFCAAPPPMFFRSTVRWADSPGSTVPSPSPPSSELETAPSSRNGAGWAMAAVKASKASRSPKPESRSRPSASMSSAVLVSAERILERDSVGRAALTSPAIAAAWGAEAEVPKNGWKPGTEVDTRRPRPRRASSSARPAVLEQELPGLEGSSREVVEHSAVPSELKTRRGCWRRP